jgi:MtfA peptidase
MIYVLILICIFIVAFIALRKRPVADFATGIIPVNDVVLNDHILFFSKLSLTDKKLFEQRIKTFLQKVTITGIKTELTEIDKLLIATGAVIPVFKFPDWEYIHLNEILVYADTFNMDFKAEGEDRNIAGLVGTGVYEGKMLLSLAAVRESFNNSTDKRNTIIHEFVHLIDKTDGDTDGIPQVLLDQQYVLPWLDLIHKKMQEILENESDIDDYGLTNKAEFFAVAAEYFFERPDLLEEKHPALYRMLRKIFLKNPA